MDTGLLISIVAVLISLTTSGGMLYLNFRKAPAELRLSNSTATDKALEATDKALALNKRYIDRIDSLEARNNDLEARLEKVEITKKYHIVVEFETSTPPQVGKVEIIPIETSGTLP